MRRVEHRRQRQKGVAIVAVDRWHHEAELSQGIQEDVIVEPEEPSGDLGVGVLIQDDQVDVPLRADLRTWLNSDWLHQPPHNRAFPNGACASILGNADGHHEPGDQHPAGQRQKHLRSIEQRRPANQPPDHAYRGRHPQRQEHWMRHSLSCAPRVGQAAHRPRRRAQRPAESGVEVGGPDGGSRARQARTPLRTRPDTAVTTTAASSTSIHPGFSATRRTTGMMANRKG